MAKIRLYGDLKQYGDKFDMNIETAAEGLRGLCCQIKGLQQRIIDGWFRVRINGVDMTTDNLQFGFTIVTTFDLFEWPSRSLESKRKYARRRRRRCRLIAKI